MRAGLHRSSFIALVAIFITCLGHLSHAQQSTNEASAANLVDKPFGWNDAKRMEAAKLLKAYDNDVDHLNQVADAATYALLAAAAYRGDDPDALTQMEELARSEGFTVRRLDPIDREGVGDLTATIFYHPDGRTVLAFRGSVTDGDWVTNWNTYSKLPLQQGQIRDAIRMAYEIEKESPGVVFVGHSLGGRLAQVASVATGRPAYAFDSAPIGNWDIPASIMVGAKEVLLGREVTLPGKITRFRNPQDVVSTMTSPLDIKVLNFVETNVGLEGLVNGEIKDAVAYTHSIDQLAQAMQNVALARDEGWVSQVLKEQADALLGRPRANDDLPPSLMSQISQIYGSDRETSGLVGSWSGSASAGGTSISLRWEISNGDPDIFVGQVIMKLPSDSSWSTYNAAGKVGGKIVTFTGAGWVTKANQNFCLAKYTGTLSETTSGTLLVGSWGPHPIHPNGCPEGARGPFRLTRNEP